MLIFTDQNWEFHLDYLAGSFFFLLLEIASSIGCLLLLNSLSILIYVESFMNVVDCNQFRACKYTSSY